MDYKGKLFLKSNPAFKMKANLNPGRCHGTFTIFGGAKIKVSEVSVKVDEIPIRLAIPFMKSCRPVLIASIGSFNAKINPFSLKIEEASVKMDIDCCLENIEGDIEGEMHCTSEIEAEGSIKGKICAKPKIDIEFDDETERG